MKKQTMTVLVIDASNKKSPVAQKQINSLSTEKCCVWDLAHLTLKEITTLAANISKDAGVKVYIANGGKMYVKETALAA